MSENWSKGFHEENQKYKGMASGIRAELKIPAAVACPMARVSATEDVTAYSMSKSVDPHAPKNVTEEFSVPSADELSAEIEGIDLEKTFTDGSSAIYRFERVSDRNCPCECIEQHGSPVIDVRGERGTLYVVFHAADRDDLRQVIETVGEYHPQMEVRRLVQSRGTEENGSKSLVFFDKSVLTDRQQQVLTTAHELGYFDHPKGANAGEVADELGIATATLIEHLSAAQRKLLNSILDTE